MRSYSLGSVLIATGFAILLGPLVVLFFLTIGPLGWALLGGSLVVVGVVISLWEDSGSDDDRRKWTNCDNCGARIDDAAGVCHRCRGSQ